MRVKKLLTAAWLYASATTGCGSLAGIDVEVEAVEVHSDTEGTTGQPQDEPALSNEKSKLNGTALVHVSTFGG